MDLLTGFVTIVGLLGQWKATTDARDSKDLDQYIDWLRRKEHAQLVDLILHNEQLSKSLRGLIEDQHVNVMAKLENLEQVLSGIAMHLEGFQPLAGALGVQSVLSDQAISILHQMNEAGAARFVESSLTRRGRRYPFVGVPGELQIDDPRLVSGDLHTLVSLGLLLECSTPKGSRCFDITREGAALGK